MATFPTPDDLRNVPEPVDACPNCGSLGMRMATHGDGTWAGGGELTLSACPSCGFTGQPIVFRRREDYLHFVTELRSSR